jgi:hypothetical protein
MLITHCSKLKTKVGIAALPTILLIGGIIVEIAIAGVFIAYFLSQSGFGAKLSAEALAAAESGVQDAFIRISRDKNFVSPSPYSVSVGSRSAQITVLGETPLPGKKQITSLGSASIKRRQLQAVVNVDSNTGEVKVESIKEIPL